MKQMTSNRKSRQGGFSILGIILVVVAIVAVLGVWATSGQTNTSNSASAAGDVMGASIANDASAIKTSFDTLLVGGSSGASITFVPATAGASNMLDPTNGIQKPNPNANALINTTFPNGAWIYKSAGFLGNAVGTQAGADQAVILGGIKDGICSQINMRLTGSAVIPPSGLTLAAIATGATADAPSSVAAADVSGVAGVLGWTSGCMTTTAGVDNNFYFRVLKAN